MDAFDRRRGSRMKQFTLCAGTVIHISGLPFYLVHDTTFEGHEANVAMATVEDPDDGGRFLINFDALRPTLFQRIRQWWLR